MERLHESLIIHAPASRCYQHWLRFEAFPQFITQLDAVWPLGPHQWRWVFKGPLGVSLTWDVAVEPDEPRRLIAWHRLDGTAKAKVSGTIRFEESGPQQTRLTCDIQYELPGGPVGEAVTHWLLSPQKILEEALQNFKYVVEGTHIPSAKAQVGKTLHPDAFWETANSGQEEGYGLGGDLGPDLSEVTPMYQADGLPETNQALERIRVEESPYLADTGALPTADLQDSQAFEEDEELMDVFTESLDITPEDLENQVEDLDEELDSSPNALMDRLNSPSGKD